MNILIRRRAHGLAGRTLMLAVAVALWAAAAAAQTTIPSPAAPEQIERRFKEPEKPRATEGEIQVPKPEPGAPPAGAAEVKFVLKGVVVEGATLFKDSDFLPLYEDLLGKEIALTQVYAIANKITAKYTAAGYILSQAVVPAQRIEAGGIVRIRVIEGFVDKVIIEGTVKGNQALLKAYGDKIAAERPLNVRTLERYLLLADDLAGAKVQGVLKPSAETPGAATLVLAVTHKDYDAFATVNNRGTKFIGPFQEVLGVNLNSTFGRYERTGARFVASGDFNELLNFNLFHEYPLGTEGTVFDANGTLTLSHPGASLVDSDIDGDTRLLSVGVAHPFIRSRRENLSLRGRFDYRDGFTDLANAALSKERTRVFRLGPSYDFVDTVLTPAVTLVGVQLSQGIDAIGARDAGQAFLTRTRGRADFTKVTFDATRVQRLGGDFSLFAGLTSQYAAQTLLASEEFAFGGSQFGRGYDPAELTGDNGVAIKLELQWANRPGLPYIRDYQVYGFYDVGKVWNRDPASGSDGQSGASTGVGIRANATDWLSFDLELAKPLTRAVSSRAEDAKGARVFFGLSVRN